MPRTLSCLRYFLIGGAIVVAICGIAKTICAGFLIYQLHEYAPLTPAHVCASPTSLVATGLITSLIGWCAWQFLDFTNRGQVTIFAAALSIITIADASIGIWALVRHEEIDILPKDHLDKAFEFATTDEKPLWGRMQSRLRCCGIDGPADYREKDAIPWSCCDTSTLLDPDENKGLCTSMYARGCQHVVLNQTRSILLRVFLLALCTVLLQACFIVCMTCYARACKESVKRRKELMAVTEALQSQTSKDPGTKDNLLNRQSRIFHSTYRNPDVTAIPHLFYTYLLYFRDAYQFSNDKRSIFLSLHMLHKAMTMI